MIEPSWYGVRYPSELDLVSCAEAIGARVLLGRFPVAAYISAVLGAPPMIVVPSQRGPLSTIWLLAHELGHLRQHRGPGNKITRSKNEQQANKWAACALIPEARVQAYQNASADAFIAALSAHYGDLPLCDCPERALAHKIAQYRLKAILARGLPQKETGAAGRGQAFYE
jgi:Zn-dependent peptidase ImmA (M78 family)